MIVSPSLLAAEKNNLVAEANKMKNAGASYIHIDIMDARFVPAYTWDHEVVRLLKEGTEGLILDTHLMIVHPEDFIMDYIEAGADILTVHIEAFDGEEKAIETLKRIRRSGVKAGISFKPATDPEALRNVLPYVDHVIVMTVEPGKGGQPFIDGQIQALGKIKSILKEIDSNALIEVDGGINQKTGEICRDFGADILVAGSYLYGHEDYKRRLRGLLEL